MWLLLGTIVLLPFGGIAATTDATAAPILGVGVLRAQTGAYSYDVPGTSATSIRDLRLRVADELHPVAPRLRRLCASKRAPL